MVSREPVAVAEIFKALSDPIRWNIVQQVGRQEEFACSILEDTLPISKPTISYHTKILTQAGLLEVRKRGRSYFYTLRWDVLREVIGELGDLLPVRLAGEPGGDARHSRAAVPDDTDAALLTW